MKKPSSVLLFVLLITAISFLECSDDSEGNAYDIYVFGNQNRKGSVWKEGVLQTDPLLSTFLLGGFVAEKDFYVAGIGEGGAPPKAVAKYWKNGSEVVLSDGKADEWAYDVAVAGSDVYAVGYDNGVNGATLRAKYWKNGNAIILGNNTDASMATDVATSGSDFYIAGWQNVNNNDSIVARVWKNGERMKLSTNSKYFYLEGIAVNGNDVHLVGYESNQFGFKKVKYWKNGVGTYLDNGDDAYPNDVVINGNDVYICGAKGDRAGFWKNGAFTQLTDQRSEAVSIIVQGKDVFVAGNILDNSNLRSGIVWKNGSVVGPFNGTDQSIRISGALLVKR